MTRTLPLASILLGAMALLASGCSSSSPRLSIEDIPAELSEAVCTQLLTCAQTRAGGGEVSRLVLSPTFPELCPRLLGAELGSLDPLAAAVDAGRVAYDAAAARRCLDDVASSCTIEAGLDFFPSCREALEGQVAVGESCSLQEECVPGARCDATLVGDTCSGTCVARLPLGTACDSASECARPDGVGIAQCSTNGGTESVCLALVLELGLREGEPCGAVDGTGFERTYGLCHGDFFCFDADEDGEGTCTAPVADGGLCMPGMACEEGSLCVEDGGTMNSFCRRITVVTEVGGACDDETVFCDYPARLECVSGECAALPEGTCHEGYHCDEGEYCDDATSTCEARKALGSECDASRECLSDSCRDDGTMTNTRRCTEPAVRCD